MKFLNKNKVSFLSIAIFSAWFHFVLIAFLYMNRTVVPSPIYCNVHLPDQKTIDKEKELSFSLSTDNKNGEQDQKKSERKNQKKELEKIIQNQQEDKNPAGKFQSSFNKNKKHAELIKRLYNSLDLKPLKQSPQQGLKNRQFAFKKKKGGKKGNEKQPIRRKGAGFPRVFEDMLQGRNINDSYIYRKRQYQDIVVKEILPSLYTIDKPFSEIIQQAPNDLKEHNIRNSIIEDFRTWKKGDDPNSFMKAQIRYKDFKKDGKNPLNFPEEERKKYLDGSLPLSKETQLNRFIAQYFHYDPDEGDLPMAIRDLYYENLQRLAYQFSSDPSYFTLDYFQENLNKEDFLKNSLAQVAELSGTKAAVEILFAIENIYEIQQRAIRFLFYFISKYDQLPTEKKDRLRMETLRRATNKYKPILSKKKIFNYKNAVELYSKKRVEIMDYLIENSTTKYRLRDALFEKGRIYWDWGKHTRNKKYMQEAMNIWSGISKIRSDQGDFLNQDAFSQIKEIGFQFNNTDFHKEIQITRILHNRLKKDMEKKRLREARLLWP